MRNSKEWILFIVGIFGAIISGVVAYYITEGPKIILPEDSSNYPAKGNGQSEKRYSCWIPETSEQCPTSSRDVLDDCYCGNPNQSGIVIPSPAPVLSPPIPSSSIALLDDILDDLEYGNIVFNAPKKMQLEESERIELLLSPTKSIEELEIELENQIDIESASIQIANRMEAHLSGKDFTVEPINSERQAISSRRTTQWLWDVIPTKSGNLTLNLSLSVYVELNDQEEEYIVDTFNKDIKVEVSPLKRISIIFTSIWQFLSGMDWFWTVIIIPLAIFIWRKYRNHDHQ